MEMSEHFIPDQHSMAELENFSEVEFLDIRVPPGH